jgi:hypothetical protein
VRLQSAVGSSGFQAWNAKCLRVERIGHWMPTKDGAGELRDADKPLIVTRMLQVSC